MKIYQLNNQTFDFLVIKTSQFLAAGGIAVIPTETCYGLAVDLNNTEAVDRLYKIKNRPNDIKLSVVVESKASVDKYARVQNFHLNWLEKHLPNTFTIIFDAKSNLSLHYPDIGIRFSTNAFVNKLAEVTNGFALTCANIHGLPETYTLVEFENQLAGMVFKPDLFIDSGELLRVPPTTVIDFRTKRPRILRQGLFRLK